MSARVFWLACVCIGLWAMGCSGTDARDETGPRPNPPVRPALEIPAAFRSPLPAPTEAGVPGDLRDLLEARVGDETYRLRPGDRVLIDVYDHPDLTIRLRVPRQGKVRYPLIGDVEIRDRSVAEVEEEIRRRLEKEFVALAPVTVLLEEARECTAYILGSVARPGAYPFPPGRPLRLLQLVAKGGGFLDGANTERLRLIRGNGEERRFWDLSVKEIEKSGRVGLDVVLEDGDTLLVPVLPRVFVLGTVRKPGAFSVRAGTRATLAHVLALAGGFDVGADREGIFVFRPREGKTTQWVTVAFSPETREGGDLPILPGDTVLVRSAARIYVLGAVTRPGGFLPAEEALSATKAISLAGGFSRRADSNGTVVIRATPQGQKVIRVRVKSVVSRETEKQVRLEPGDIVFVPERFF
jgi:polysaccharide export outer membrane protein